MSPTNIAELLPQVRGLLPLADIDALNRLARTLCDVLETTLDVSPPPVNQNVSEIETNRVARNAVVAVPALMPQEFLFSALLDGPRPATAVERMAREQYGWPPRVLFKARQQMRVKAIRCGFGPGGYWTWKLPGHMTDKDVHFHPGEWRSFIAGHVIEFLTLASTMPGKCEHQWRSLPDRHI
jgi:hypothetical protein